MLFSLPFAVIGIFLAFSAARSGGADQIILRATMSLLFGGVGFGLFISSFTSKKAAAKTRALMDQNPGKPWMWREDWAQGFALPEWKQTSTAFTAIGTFCLLLSVPIFQSMQTEFLQKGRYLTLLALAFPIVGISMIGHSSVIYLRSRKFRNLRFTLSKVPGVIGGRVQGKVQAAFAIPSGQTADAILSCVHSYSSDSESRWERVLWQERETVAFYSDGQETYLPVDVAIPSDLRETDGKNPDDAILWRLAVNTELPGLDFSASFLAPVFKTEASDPNQTVQWLEAQNEARLGRTMPPDAKIAVGSGPDGGVRFYFAPARNKKAAAMLTVFGVLCIGGGLFFGYASAQVFTWFVGVLPLLLSGGVGLLLLAVAFWLWFGATTVEVVRHELHVRSGCFGLSRSRVVPASDIRELELYSGMQSGNDVWYDLKVRLVNGRSFTAGSAMLKPEAEWFRAELKKDLGIRL